MLSVDDLPRLYSDFAEWWPLLSAPEDYAEEVDAYLRLLRDVVDGELRRALELGSGGGNNAHHYARSLELTLVDRSPRMLAVSRALNPRCEHLQGDMRDVRLGRTFDAVLVHDAVAYLMTEDDLRAAMATAFEHCRPGGVALFTPDHVRESFTPGTSHGGHDGERRALRYLEWRYDPDPADTLITVDMAYLLREGEHAKAVFDRHLLGLFPRASWLRLLAEVGFDAQALTYRLTGMPDALEAFVGRRPA
jgi:SAM-dependent methyltransferase